MGARSEMSGTPSNLGFVLYREMGLPLVKIVASKRTLRNPVYQPIPSQLFAEETSSPHQDLLALVWVPIILFPFAYGQCLNITLRCRLRQWFLARCNPTFSLPPPLLPQTPWTA